MRTNQLIVVDIEAQCWEKTIEVPDHKKEIIEIGICRVNLGQGVITDVNQYYVRPKHIDISEYCTSLTGITAEILIQHGRPLHEVLNRINRTYPIRNRAWGGWGRGDYNHLLMECGHKEIPFLFNNQYIDIKHIYGMMKRLRVSVGLKAALEATGLGICGKHHCGRDDAFNEGRLVLSLFCGYEVALACKYPVCP